MQKNFFTSGDSYKYGHWSIYTPGLKNMFSYLAPRGGHLQKVVPFGIQYFLKEYFVGEVLNWDQHQKMVRRCKSHFGSDKVYNEKGFARLIEKHQGRLPLSIKSALEGTPIDNPNVIMTVESTDPEFAWLVNFVESQLSECWGGTTVASYGHAIANTALHFLERTGTPEKLPWVMNDFGLRGVPCPEAAGILGAGHLVHFRGTDNQKALDLVQDYYGVDIDHCAGDSIVATEHSVMTMEGREGESAAVKRLLDKNPKGLIACVGDSYNMMSFVENIIGTEHREQILNRDGTFVVRPDSGSPPEMSLAVIKALGDKFGYERNKKGFKVLNPKVATIYGDKIDLDMMNEVLLAITSNDWSADNIVFGSGGGLLQRHDRDEMKFAFKLSAAEIEGAGWVDVFKDPITDSGKKSYKGRLALTMDSYGHYHTSTENSGQNHLVEVFRDGKLLIDQTFDEIRNRAKLTVSK